MRITPVRLVSVWLLLASAFALAAAGDKRGAASGCPKELAAYVASTPIARETLQAVLANTNADPLIQQFELEHLMAMRTQGLRGAITWREFHPTWILKSPEFTEALLEHFDPLGDGEPQYPHGLVAWVNEWESLYTNQFGACTLAWLTGGKRAFTQRLLVLLAVRHARHYRYGNQPRIFTAQPEVTQEDRPTYSPLTAQITVAFSGDERAFQKAFDREYRRQEKLTAHHAQGQVPLLERTVRSALASAAQTVVERSVRGSALRGLREWKPVVAASLRERTKEDDILVALESVREFSQSSTPLAGLFREEQDEGFSGQVLIAIASRHRGGLAGFIAALNYRLEKEQLSPLQPTLGCTNLAQEVIVQAAATYVAMRGTSGMANFAGFQADDPDAGYYVDMDNDLIIRSSLNLVNLNALVAKRLGLSLEY